MQKGGEGRQTRPSQSESQTPRHHYGSLAVRSLARSFAVKLKLSQKCSALPQSWLCSVARAAAAAAAKERRESRRSTKPPLHRSSSETTTTTIISSATPPSPPPPQPKHPYSLRLLTRERTDGRTNERRIIGGPVSDDAETETAPQSDRFSFPLAKEQNCPPTPNRQFCKELCVNCALKTIDVKRASRSLLSAGTNYSRLRSVADHCGSLGSIEPG